MSGRKRASSVTGLPVMERKHCPRCTFYLDGRQVENFNPFTEERTLFFFPIPGMQFHQKSTGTEYEKQGFATPCICAAGNLVAAGYDKDRGYRSADKPKERNVERIENYVRDTLRKFQGPVPMPMDNF